MAAYAGLSADEAADYTVVKAVILRWYEISEETHCLHFRQDRKKKSESYHEWMMRLQEHFSRRTKDQTMLIRELVIMEQFMQGLWLPKGLWVWLKERKPQTLEEASKLADNYVLVRKNEETSTLRRQALLLNPSNAPPKRTAPPQGDRLRTNVNSEKWCYQCGKWGYLMFNCPNRKPSQANATSKLAMYGDAYPDVAWNGGSQKCLRQGYLGDQPVRMLIDTGSNLSMVAAIWINLEDVNYGNTEPVVCVHTQRHHAVPYCYSDVATGGME